MSSNGSSIVAWHERPSEDPITGEEGVLRKEWRIQPLEALHRQALVDVFGPRYPASAAYVIEMRYIRRGKDEGWAPWSLAESWEDAIRQIPGDAVRGCARTKREAVAALRAAARPWCRLRGEMKIGVRWFVYPRSWEERKSILNGSDCAYTPSVRIRTSTD